MSPNDIKTGFNRMIAAVRKVAKGAGVSMAHARRKLRLIHPSSVVGDDGEALFSGTRAECEDFLGTSACVDPDVMERGGYRIVPGQDTAP